MESEIRGTNSQPRGMPKESLQRIRPASLAFTSEGESPDWNRSRWLRRREQSPMASALNTVEMPARPEATLPALFAPWLRAVAGGTIAGETKATCDHCAMLPTAESVPGPAFFHPATKCCAYQPSLPNFLAGAILSDEDPRVAEGRG